MGQAHLPPQEIEICELNFRFGSRAAITNRPLSTRCGRWARQFDRLQMKRLLPIDVRAQVAAVGGKAGAHVTGRIGTNSSSSHPKRRKGGRSKIFLRRALFSVTEW